MTNLEKKIIGFEETIISSSWDLLLKNQTIFFPQLTRVSVTTRHANNYRRSHYFFRFIENLFYLQPRFIKFKPSKLLLTKEKYTGKHIKKYLLYYSSLDIVKSELEMYQCAYFTLLFLGWGNKPKYLSRHFGPHFVSLSIKDLTSYNVLFLHDYPQDDNWDQPIHVRLFIGYVKHIERDNKIIISKSRGKKRKLQYFSLFKIYPKI